MTKTGEKEFNYILDALNKIDLWDINIREISNALSKGLNTHRYVAFSYRGGKRNLAHYNGIDKSRISQVIKKSKNSFTFDFAEGENSYKIIIFPERKTRISDSQHSNIQHLLSIISKALSIRQVSKNRIIETQIINQLNLNVITTLDENKIVQNLETAARKMLTTKDVFLFYFKDDQVIGSKASFKISEIPRAIYNELFSTQHIFTVEKKYRSFARKIFANHSDKLTFIPFTIKNEIRGFFVISDELLNKKRNLTITRLRFLANQTALALERVDLFRALNRALRESHGLQELTKIMLSSLDVSSLFHEILQRAQKFLGFKRILFSLFDPQTKSFRRVTGIGISARKLRAAKLVQPPLKIINELFQNRYRISNSYYTPARAAAKIDKKISKYELYKAPRDKERIGNLWDPGDVFVSPIYSKDRELIALLSLDKPINKLVPTVEKVKLLETFGDFLGMTIANTQLFEKIEKLSNTDEMTGVYNYRFLREKLKILIHDNVSSITTIMIDLDNFKKYNDKYGHLSGDGLLRIFSQNLVNIVNKSGYVVRYGGDEFIILLPKVNLTSSKRLIRKITNIISESKIKKSAAPIAFSYGIAVYPKNGSNLGALIDCADKLLYQQKAKKYAKR